MRLLLVVEDDLATRNVMAALLTDVGYSVCEAADAPRALAKLRGLHPDLVVLDYGLPAPAHGEDFLRAKAADPEIAAVPVIVVSGFDVPSEMDGTVAVIKKPFDFDGLLAIVRRIVGPPQQPDTNVAA